MVAYLSSIIILSVCLIYTNIYDMEELLKLWGFEAFVHTFLENEVDLEALPLLDDDQIKVLIPAIGPQAKFKKALVDWKLTLQNTELNDIIRRYGDNIGGLTPTRSSPIFSPTSSPSTSACSVSTDDRQNVHYVKDITTLLKKSQDGKLLLKHCQEPLGHRLRKILTSEIAKHIVKNDPKAPVTSEIYNHWIGEIQRVFTAENISTYYTAAPRGHGRAHGRLYDAVTNLKANYRRNKIYEPRSRRCLDNTLTPSSPSNSNKRTDRFELEPTAEKSRDPLSDTDIEECLEWLRSSADNYALCLDKWNTTRTRRFNILLELDTQQYLQDFPCLKRAYGKDLLIADFHQWYPGNELSFENKFPLLKNKLIAAFEKISKKSQYITNLKTLAKNSDPENSTLAALLIIPNLLGPVYVKRKKFSAAEVCESFIQNIEEESQLIVVRQNRRNRYRDIGITVQPYIIVAGPLDNIRSRYVIFDDILYELSTISGAVDTCFKIIWALYLKYPCECLPVWQFLQRAIYDVPTKVDKNKVPVSVFELLSDCGINKYKNDSLFSV